MTMLLNSLLIKLRNSDEALKEVTAERRKDHDNVLASMIKDGIKTITTEDGPDDVTGTYVGGILITIDEDRLRKEIGATAFDKLTKKVLDQEKISEAIAQGKLDPVTVAACSTEKERAPYVRLTVRKGVRKLIKQRKPTQAGKKVATAAGKKVKR